MGKLKHNPYVRKVAPNMCSLRHSKKKDSKSKHTGATKIHKPTQPAVSRERKVQGPEIREDEDPRTAVTGYDLISYLLRNKMILLPIEMDPFGQLRPVIRLMLHEKHK